MTATVSSIVFDGMFAVDAIDKEGKKFDRVSRLYAYSQNDDDIRLTLDYNVELFSLKTKDEFSLALATTLSRTGPTAGEDGTETETNEWRPDRKGKTGGLDDDYEYVMSGRIYRFDAVGETVTAYVSFGGLLMSLTGSFRHLTDIVLGDPVYLLMRKLMRK